MTATPFKVGIIGLEPGRSWAARAHVPALRALPDDFEIVGVANTSIESSQRAATETGIPIPFANADELVASPDIDVVTVTVRVSRHLELVKAALNAGKHVYCEFPLANGLAEAEELAALARAKGVLGVIGTQARVAPQVQYLKQLILDGYIGDVLSTTLIARGGQWGGVVPDKANGAYLLDNAEGATMLTIPVGHTLAGLQEALGDITQLSSVLATRRTTALVAGTGETLPVTAPDQVLVSGVLESGAPVSIHYRGGLARDGDGLLWEINGTKGDIRLKGPMGHLQLVPLSIEAARGDDKAFQPLKIPAVHLAGLPFEPVPNNVARNYARLAHDLRERTRTAPTFEDAVALHRVLAAIEQSAESGRRVAW